MFQALGDDETIWQHRYLKFLEEAIPPDEWSVAGRAGRLMANLRKNDCRVDVGGWGKINLSPFCSMSSFCPFRLWCPEMKKMMKKAVDLLPASITDRIYAIRHRIHWLVGKGAKCHETYFHESRTQLLDVVRSWLNENPRAALRVLELGSSGGNNLELLRNGLSIPIHYVGLDIQADAIAFAKKQFPNDMFIVGDDRRLIELVPDLERFDLFLASAIFYYLPQKRVEDVLTSVAKVADYVLVYDYLNQFACAEGVRDGLFLHPYSRMCREANLEIVRQPSSSAIRNLENDRCHEIFMARSLTR